MGVRFRRGKVEALQKWVDFKSGDDVNSFLAYCNYLSEFIDGWEEHQQVLRPYTLKPASAGYKPFSEYQNDTAAQEARKQLIEGLSTAAIVEPDFEAAADYMNSGRPFELFVDASDAGFTVVLAQRKAPGGTPIPIGCARRKWSPTEQRWSAFERELKGMKEGYDLAEKWVKGYTVFLWTDHKNNVEFERALKTRRA